MSEPSFLNIPDQGFAFLEPRYLFDNAISSLESSVDVSKIYYNESKVKDICLKHYSNKVWDKLKKDVSSISEVIEFV
jgi:hypothetical protein